MEGTKIVTNQSTGDYNITVDFAYEIIEKGGKMNYHDAKNVPIIKRVTEANTNEEKCKLTFHGSYDSLTNDCSYFVEARKICLVMDMEEDYQLHSNYENYRCNYLDYNKDYVMFFNMRWHAARDPTL